MHRRTIARLAALAALLVLALPAIPAAADPNPPVESFTYTANMEPLGFSARPNPASGIYNTDLAFWGNRAYQGTYDGFQIIDISNPEDPQKLNDYRGCSGTSSSNQGDMIVWEDLLVRSWNSAAAAGNLCDGQAVPSGFEGIHIFDVSDPADPALVGSVNVPSCGSHTATGVPDVANNRLLVYNNASSIGACAGFDVISIPLDNPAGATLLRHETPSPSRSCHDVSVIFGDAMLAACAGGNGFAVFSIGGPRGGSLEDPLQLHSQTLAGVTIGHAATFSWDGRTLIFGHEPGGGSQAQCQATSAITNKTMYFFDTQTFTEVGRWVLPRPQTSAENCTIHTMNVVPSDRRNIVVSGNYQSGVSVVDFTDRTAPTEIAYADPAPLTPTTLGGDWSSYWYDGHIYESDITRGLLTWRLNDTRVAGAQTLGHLNPQTQEFTMEPLKADLTLAMDGSPDRVNVGDEVTFDIGVSSAGPEIAEGIRVTDALSGSFDFEAAATSQGTCTHDGAALGGVVACDLGTLDPEASASIELTVTARKAGFVQNTALLTGALMDPNQADNTRTEGTIVNAFPAALDPGFALEGDQATVSGAVAFPAITSPETVGGTKTALNPQTEPAASAAGVNLVGGKVLPITGGLRFVWEVTGMPDAQAGVPPEGVRYAWTLQVSGGSVYQLEAKRSSVASVNTTEDPAQHLQHAATGTSFRLRGACETEYEGLPVAECHHLAYLNGQFDYANKQITIDWPFETKNPLGQTVAPDYKAGAALVNTTFGGMSISGSLQPVVASSDTALSNFINGWNPYYVGPRVQLAVGPAGLDPSTLGYDPAATLANGTFSGQVSGVGGTNDTVYARACNGETCAFASLKVA